MRAPADEHARIDDLFAIFGPVKVRRMFGGAGLYADETMFGILESGVIYLKADERFAADFIREGCPRFTYRKNGRPVAISYWRLPERLYDDPDALAEWARRSLGCAKPRAKKGRRE